MGLIENIAVTDTLGTVVIHHVIVTGAERVVKTAMVVMIIVEVAMNEVSIVVNMAVVVTEMRAGMKITALGKVVVMIAAIVVIVVVVVTVLTELITLEVTVVMIGSLVVSVIIALIVMLVVSQGEVNMCPTPPGHCGVLNTLHTGLEIVIKGVNHLHVKIVMLCVLFASVEDIPRGFS